VFCSLFRRPNGIPCEADQSKHISGTYRERVANGNTPAPALAGVHIARTKGCLENGSKAMLEDVGIDDAADMFDQDPFLVEARLDGELGGNGGAVVVSARCAQGFGGEGAGYVSAAGEHVCGPGQGGEGVQ
jgi:hypothetical protein